MSTSGHDAHKYDIIPPFEGYPGKNWDKEHREVYSNDCEEIEYTSTSTSGPANTYPENTDPEDSYPEYTTPTTAVPTTVAPTTTVVVEESTTTLAGTTTTVEGTTTTTIEETTTTSTVAVGPPTSVESTTTLVAVAPPTVPGNPALPTSGGSPASTVLTGAFGLLLGLVLTLATRRRTLIASVAE